MRIWLVTLLLLVNSYSFVHVAKAQQPPLPQGIGAPPIPKPEDQEKDFTLQATQAQVDQLAKQVTQCIAKFSVAAGQSAAQAQVSQQTIGNIQKQLDDANKKIADITAKAKAAGVTIEDKPAEKPALPPTPVPVVPAPSTVLPPAVIPPTAPNP